MTITHRWERVIAVGCSHGQQIDPSARRAVLRFRERYKPRHVLHLGDWADTTAFMSGAAGKAEEAEPIGPDIDSGLQFLSDLRPTVICLGNHEDRIWRMARHFNAIKARLAALTIGAIEDAAERLGAVLVPWSGHECGWHTLGGYRWGHGVLWNEMYLRDTAEVFGPTVVAHGHRAGVECGRRSDHPMCYGVGALCGAASMEYAKARKQTQAWAAGFVWGEVCPDLAKSQLYVHIQPQGGDQWRTPAV